MKQMHDEARRAGIQ